MTRFTSPNLLRASLIPLFACSPFATRVHAQASTQPTAQIHQRTPLMPVAAVAAAASDQPADFKNSAPAGEALSLVVGRSTFINTRHRLSRVFVTNPAVLDSYTASPNQIVLTARSPGWRPATRCCSTAYASATWRRSI